MSLIHKIAFSVIAKGKADYNSDKPKDYVEARIRAEKNVPKIPRSVNRKYMKLNEAGIEFLSSAKNPKDKIVFYIHGGGFVEASALARRSFTLYVVQKLGLNVAAIDYRLAPENPYPAAVEDCLEAYQFVVKHVEPSGIVMAGESAGGNLVFATVLKAKAENIPLPSCMAAFSPTVQYSKVFPSYTDNLTTDCIVTNLSDEVKATYLKGVELGKAEYAEPLYGDLKGLPPTFLSVSNSEVLFDDSLMMYGKLIESGAYCRLKIYDKLMHAFQTVPIFPETKKALKDFKEFAEKFLGL